MNLFVKTDRVDGSVNIISSKSHLHRVLIVCALSKDKTPKKIYYFGKLSLDVLSTVSCLKKIGAKIAVYKKFIRVLPIDKPIDNVEVNCGESGSTLRFILPVFSSLGISYKVNVKGRLASRPLSPLYELMQENGVKFSKMGEYPMSVSGKLSLPKNKEFVISGKISSQFITGLMLSLPLLGGGKVAVSGAFESKPYCDITSSVMRLAGVSVIEQDNVYLIENEYSFPQSVLAEGDWSNSAFFIALGCLKGGVKVLGLNHASNQGDKEIVNILKKLGATIEKVENGVVISKPQNIIGGDIDVKNVPDLVPILAVCLAFSKNGGTIYNAGRLRLKESDRITSVVSLINDLGGCAIDGGDKIIVHGKRLVGGRISAFNDHRIVMSGAIASAVTEKGVEIIGAEAVNKSYPQFFEELQKLGFFVKEI